MVTPCMSKSSLAPEEKAGHVCLEWMGGPPPAPQPRYATIRPALMGFRTARHIGRRVDVPPAFAYRSGTTEQTGSAQVAQGAQVEQVADRAHSARFERRMRYVRCRTE
jgi:hypothetical protein